MARNLKYQFLNAITQNFKEKMDKHSIKADGKMNGTRIFSYSDRKNLIDVSCNLANYLSDNNPEIKFVKDIKAHHIQGFLNKKSKTCSQATIKQYATKFNKLENVVNSTYNANANYKGFRVPLTKENTKIRNMSMSREDFLKLEKGFSNSKSCAKEAIQLSSRAGLRVSEITKLQGRDINISKGVINIVDSKGGRDREVPIRPQDRDYFIDLKSKYNDYERICPVKSDSINKAIERELEKQGLKEKYTNTSIHSIRKLYAQEEFDRLREEGLEIKQALGEVSVLLGHSDNRFELMKEYVLDIK